MDDLTPSKIDIQYADYLVIFSICDCSLDKKLSFFKLDKEEAKKLINRLRYIEKMSWKQLATLRREEGLTVEKPGSDNFKMISQQDSSPEKLIGGQHYFHIRIEEKGLYRIFGYQKRQVFSITHIDPRGKINH